MINYSFISDTIRRQTQLLHCRIEYPISHYMRDAKRDVYKDVLINVCSKYNKEMTFSLSLSLLVYPPLIISLSLHLHVSVLCFIFLSFI